MAQARFYNRGTLRGILTRCEIVNFEGKNGKAGGHFLSFEVDTGNKNRVKGTVFPTKANPNRAKELADQFKVGAKVEIAGNIQEKPFTSNAGKEGVDRSISTSAIKVLTEDKAGATFILQGIVEKIRETSEGGEVTVWLDTSYKDKAGAVVEQSETVTLFADGDGMALIEELDIAKGDNVKFKGIIVNKLLVDDFDDIIGSVNMYKISTASDVIAKADIEQPEELSFV